MYMSCMKKGFSHIMPCTDCLVIFAGKETRQLCQNCKKLVPRKVCKRHKLIFGNTPNPVSSTGTSADPSDTYTHSDDVTGAEDNAIIEPTVAECTCSDSSDSSESEPMRSLSLKTVT